MHDAPTVGSFAPEFDLAATVAPGGRVRLSDFRGRWLVLVFYPRDFSLVCPTELSALSGRLTDFEKQGCAIVGVSSDTLDSHIRWVTTSRAAGGLGSLRFPLAADPDGDACRAYGVFLEAQRVALRGLFIIDPNGILQYQAVHNLSVGRRTDEILRVLAALQTGGLCSEGWGPEQQTLDVSGLLVPGTMLSHYRIEEELGTGAFAKVFRAHDTRLERTVALKVVKPDSTVNPQTLLAEARAAAALNHPNVCTVYSVDNSEGVPVIAMEYLAGSSLASLVADGQLPASRAISIGAQVASGMAVAHAQGVVHGDLKPANVFVTNEGNAKILDFGLARRKPPASDPEATADLTAGSSGGVAGTPGYMSPEQVAGEEPRPASDVFSLGVIFYELATGKRAFSGENLLQTLNRIRQVDSRTMSAGVSPPFGELLKTMLARDIADRTIAMSDVAARLNAALTTA